MVGRHLVRVRVRARGRVRRLAETKPEADTHGGGRVEVAAE